MRIVRGRGDARWLPARFNFALFRLYGWLRMRAAKPEPVDAILVIDRNQNAFEMFGVGIWLLLTTSCYVADLLAPWLPMPVAAIVAPPVAIFVALQFPVFFTGLLVTPWVVRAWNAVAPARVHEGRVNSILYMLLFAAASAWFATRGSWVRFVAWHALALMALNAVASAIAFLLRGEFARLEASVGGAASAR